MSLSRRAPQDPKGSPFRGEGADTDRCECGHERELHLADECVGCADSLGCRGFKLRPPVDRIALSARIVEDLRGLSDFDMERAEHAVAKLANRPVTRAS